MADYRFDLVPLVCYRTGKLKVTQQNECTLQSGTSFLAQYYNKALGAGSSISLLFVTPNNDDLTVTMEVGFSGSKAGEMVIWEAPAATAAANPVDAICLNRKNPTVATCVVTHTPTGVDTSGATKLKDDIFGSVGGNPSQDDTGGGGVSRNRRMLKPNTKYLITLTNDDSTDPGAFELDIYWDEIEYPNDTYYAKELA